MMKLIYRLFFNRRPEVEISEESSEESSYESILKKILRINLRRYSEED